MAKLFVKKLIQINAPALRVWDVLTRREYTDRWAREFSSGDATFHLESDWQQGHPVLWKGQDGKTLVEGKVLICEPYKRLHYSVIDVAWGLAPGMDERDGISYTLSQNDQSTTLSIAQGDFGKMADGKKYYAMTAAVWDRVLPQIKMFAENKPMNEREWIEQLTQEGYRDVRVCPVNAPNNDFGEHTHDQHTVHVILQGTLTLIDKQGEQTLKAGDRFEIPAGTTHVAKTGSEGCRFVVGVKK